MKDINLQIQEFRQTPNRMSTKKTMSSYIIAKLLETKGKKQPKQTHIGGYDLITCPLLIRQQWK